jgi:hypothetical protein
MACFSVKYIFSFLRFRLVAEDPAFIHNHYAIQQTVAFVLHIIGKVHAIKAFSFHGKSGH